MQAYGAIGTIEDRDWLAAHVAALTRSREAGREQPWSVADAPAAFIEAQLRGIVGIEIPISRIEAKWKVSQNRPAADRDGVVEGLRSAGDEASLAMAELVAERRAP